MYGVDAIKSKKDIAKIKRHMHGRDRTLFVLGISLGLRISDLLKLKIGDLRGKQYLEIRESKTDKRRRIDFNKTVLSEIKSLVGDDNEYVFKSRKGANSPISRTQAYRILNAAVKRSGIDYLSVGTHTLRKTHGWLLYNNGVALSRIMAMFNHSSEAVTARYIGITADEIKEAYMSIEI